MLVLLMVSTLTLSGASSTGETFPPWAAAAGNRPSSPTQPVTLRLTESRDRTADQASRARRPVGTSADQRSLAPLRYADGAGVAGPAVEPVATSHDSVRAAKIRVVDATGTPGPRARGGEPSRVVLPDAAIDLQVVPTGVNDNGTMELPSTVTRAGWYRYSSRPDDDRGTTVIAAHVDTRREGLGAFAALRSVRTGADVVLTDRRGRETRYRVLVRRMVPRTRLPVDDLFDRAGSPRLVLITCGGQYDAEAGYTDNVVVLAERLR